MLMCVADVHGRSFWKDATSNYINLVDKVIFLGDYVDRYENEGISRNDELENFKQIIDFKSKYNDKVILLLGNHCYHYINDDFPRSTRYSSSNAHAYRELYMQNINMFKVAHTEIVNDKTFLFTHAGVMRSWYNNHRDIIGDLTEDNLNNLMKSPQGCYALSTISKYRTYFGSESGSILWSDLREKIDLKSSNDDNIIINQDSVVEEFDYQIFGHTQLVDKPIITDKWACLDCRKAFLINDEGEIKQV